MQNIKNKKYSVLALSGGGMRGLYTATILAAIEEDINARIATRFDLICGTSIGGIIALALAAEIPAIEIKKFFEEKGNLIFEKTWLKKIAGHKPLSWMPLLQKPIMSAHYSSDNLKRELSEIFCDYNVSTVGDLKHPILVPTINYVKNAPVVFKTPHHPNFKQDFKRKVIDVALATAAAPTYFPIHKTDYGEFVDGGLLVNSPGLFGYIEICNFLHTDPTPPDLSVLSIGTMSPLNGINPRTSRNRGFLQWGPEIVELMLATQEASNDNILKFLLKDNYLKIDSLIPTDQLGIIGLDNASNEAQRLLTQHANDTFKQNSTQISSMLKKFSPRKPEFFYGPHSTNK